MIESGVEEDSTPTRYMNPRNERKTTIMRPIATRKRGFQTLVLSEMTRKTPPQRKRRGGGGGGPGQVQVNGPPPLQVGHLGAGGEDGEEHPQDVKHPGEHGLAGDAPGVE